jgi:hypothetical protein
VLGEDLSVQIVSTTQAGDMALQVTMKVAAVERTSADDLIADIQSVLTDGTFERALSASPTLSASSVSVVQAPSVSNGDDEGSNNTGVVVGGVIGALLGAALLIGVALFLSRRAAHKSVTPTHVSNPLFVGESSE